MTEQIEALKTKLESTNDFLERMTIMDDIHELEVKAGIRKPRNVNDSYFECVGCSS